MAGKIEVELVLCPNPNHCLALALRLPMHRFAWEDITTLDKTTNLAKLKPGRVSWFIYPQWHFRLRHGTTGQWPVMCWCVVKIFTRPALGIGSGQGCRVMGGWLQSVTSQAGSHRWCASLICRWLTVIVLDCSSMRAITAAGMSINLLNHI